jgi:hypothetical protein
VSTPLTRAGLAVTALAATVTLASCATGAPPFLEASTGDIVAVSTYESTVWEQALYQGTPAWGAAGCMTTGEGPDAHLMVFPKDTRLDDDVIVLPDGFRIRAGDEVGLGGGFHTPDPENETLAAIPAECLTEEIFWASGEVAE